jgi:hypothetical protein
MERTQIRGTHPYSYRSGTWATYLGIERHKHRECYHVRFPDGIEDWWYVDDTSAGYEFQ